MFPTGSLLDVSRGFGKMTHVAESDQCFPPRQWLSTISSPHAKVWLSLRRTDSHVRWEQWEQSPQTLVPIQVAHVLCCMYTHLNIHKRGVQQSPPTLQSQRSLTSFALLGRCHVDVGQSDISRLVLDEQQADEGENHADHPRGWQDGPPAVGLGQHRGDDGAQAACQVHAAGQDGPPGPKLGGLEPLRRGLRGIEELMLKTELMKWCLHHRMEHCTNTRCVQERLHQHRLIIVGIILLVIIFHKERHTNQLPGLECLNRCSTTVSDLSFAPNKPSFHRLSAQLTIRHISKQINWRASGGIPDQTWAAGSHPPCAAFCRRGASRGPGPGRWGTTGRRRRRRWRTRRRPHWCLPPQTGQWRRASGRWSGLTARRWWTYW